MSSPLCPGSAPAPWFRYSSVVEEGVAPCGKLSTQRGVHPEAYLPLVALVNTRSPAPLEGRAHARSGGMS